VDQTAVDRKIEAGKRTQSVGQTAVRQLVSNLSALSDAGHQSATAETRKVVGDVRATGPEGVGELGGIGRPVEQPDEDASSSGIGEGSTNSTQGVEVR